MTKKTGASYKDDKFHLPPTLHDPKSRSLSSFLRETMTDPWIVTFLSMMGILAVIGTIWLD